MMAYFVRLKVERAKQLLRETPMPIAEISDSLSFDNPNYFSKTFKKISFALRLQEDADIIKDIEAAKAEGLSLREWLRRIYDNK